jgi:hypothetical protein
LGVGTAVLRLAISAPAFVSSAILVGALIPCHSDLLMIFLHHIIIVLMDPKRTEVIIHEVGHTV